MTETGEKDRIQTDLQILKNQVILFAFGVKLERTSVLSGVKLVDPR